MTKLQQNMLFHVLDNRQFLPTWYPYEFMRLTDDIIGDILYNRNSMTPDCIEYLNKLNTLVIRKLGNKSISRY